MPNQILQPELTYTYEGRVYKNKVTLEVTDDRIYFIQSPFKFKDELKACFRGNRWHGRPDEKPRPRKIWSIDNCPGNIFQIQALAGNNPYEWFERPLEDVVFNRDDILQPHQKDMVRRVLTYHYQILAAEQRLGKTLAVIEAMELSGKKNWWYVGPRSALESVELELEKWGLGDTINLITMTPESLTEKVQYNFASIKNNCPEGIILDESSYYKNPAAKRTVAAQSVADLIREKHGMDGYVVLLSGTPTAKAPLDIWAQAEICYPGYLREGSFNEFEKRVRIMEEATNMDGTAYLQKGPFIPEEVAKIPRRVEGLMTVYRRKDCLPFLPEKVYKTIRLQPTEKVQRVMRSIGRLAPNTISALTAWRALSSGFQYVTKQVGIKECPVCHGSGTYSQPTEDSCPGCMGVGTIPEFDRETVKVETPKDDAMRKIMDQYEQHGRLVCFASLQGSIDRVLDLAIERAWATVTIDGRGWIVRDSMGNQIRDVEPLRFWKDHPSKVMLIGNPGSARYGLNLSLAIAIVFYDNDFSAEHRLQAEDRIFAIDMDLECSPTIFDLIHLEVDQMVLDTLKANKELEHLSLGVINERIGIGGDDDSGCVEEELLPVLA